MQYKFYLDGNLIEEEPLGWDAMLVKVARDPDLKTVLVNVDATLTFTNDGYDYLKSVYDSSDYCNETIISVHRSVDDGLNFIERYYGLLFLSDMTFDDFNCSVEVKFTDDSFYGRINSRRKAEIYPTADKTINAEEIIPATVYEMELFDPATGATLPTVQTSGMYRVYDALSYLVSAITDNQVEFDSPIFGTSGDFANLALTYGFMIRSSGNGVVRSLAEFTSHMPALTFEKLFIELDRRINLGIFIDTSGAKPKLIIDEWKELFISNDISTFPDLPNLKTSIASEFIYSAIKFGGTKTLQLPAASFPGDVPWIGFKLEQYSVTGKCNKENIKDLTYDFVSDTNVIEQIAVLSGIDDSYDKDWFLIDCDRSGIRLVARQSNWLGLAPFQYYNERFINQSVSERFFGFIPDAIAAYIGAGVSDPKFQAQLTLPLAGVFQNGTGTEVFPVGYNDDSNPPNYDPNGVYDNVAFEFVAPAAGAYTFYASVNLFVLRQNGGNHSDVNLVFKRYDGANVFISDTQAQVVDRRNTAAIHDFTFVAGVKTIYLALGDKCRVGVTFDGSNTTAVLFSPTALYPDVDRSTFRCISGTNGGGEVQDYDPANYPIILNEFTTEIKTSQVDAIIADPLSKLRFYIEPSIQKSAWIDDVSINEFEGTITAKLLSSRTEEPKLPPLELRQVQFSGSLPDTPFDISLTDFYGNPLTGDNITNRVLFYEVGKALNVSIGAAHMGCAAGNASGFTIYITKTTDLGVVTVQSVSVPALSISFIVESGTDYLVQLGYDLGGVGNTFPVVAPVISAPTTAGSNGSATIFVIAPSVLGDYTFLWNGPGGITGTTNVIIGPAGDYTCLVTYTPGTFDNNMILFNVQIPISETGA